MKNIARESEALVPAPTHYGREVMGDGAPWSAANYLSKPTKWVQITQKFSPSELQTPLLNCQRSLWILPTQITNHRRKEKHLTIVEVQSEVCGRRGRRGKFFGVLLMLDMKYSQGKILVRERNK